MHLILHALLNILYVTLLKEATKVILLLVLLLLLLLLLLVVLLLLSVVAFSNLRVVSDILLTVVIQLIDVDVGELLTLVKI